MADNETSLVDEFMAANAEVNPSTESTESKAVDAGAETAPNTPDTVADPMPEDDGGTEESATEDGSANQAQANEDPNVPKKSISHRKAKKLNYENNFLKKRVEELEAIVFKQNNQSQAPEDKELPEPTRAAFPSDEEYYRALSRWNTAKALAEQKQFADKAEEAKRKSELFQQEWTAKIVKCFTDKAEQEEWDNHCKAGAPTLMNMVGPQLATYLYSIDDGPKVQMYLWTHPNATERLANAHPMEQAEMIRNIRAFVGRPKQQTNQPNVQQVAQPKPFGSARVGAGTTPTVDIGNASAEEVFDLLAQ